MQKAIYPSLKDKVAFNSGGASGIGESIVRHFAEQGSKVGFVNARSTNSIRPIARA